MLKIHLTNVCITGRLYALQQGLVLDAKSKEALTFLTTLMTWLENVKKNLKSDEVITSKQ